MVLGNFFLKTRKNLLLICCLLSWIFFLDVSLQKFTGVNKQLIVGYNSIHPFLFYLSLTLSGLTFLKVEHFAKINNNVLLFCITIALLLGGYWGLGNSVWGYFWVNDSIEIYLLCILCLMIFYTHSVNNYNSIFLFSLFFFCGCIILLFMRYGLFFTRHSFFDLKNVSNLFLLYSFIMFNNRIKFKVLLLIFFLKNIQIYYMFILTYVGYWLIIKLNITLKFLHSFVFVNLLLWSKTKPLNLVIFKLKTIFTHNSLYFSLLAIKNKVFFIKSKKVIKVLLYTNLYSIYPIKLTVKSILLLTTYIYTIWVVIFF